MNRLPRRAFGTALVAGVGERFEHRGVPGRNPDVLGRTAGNEIAVSLSFCARALRGSFGRCRSTISPLLNAPANPSPLLRRTGGTRSRRGMSAIRAKRTVGVDIKLTLHPFWTSPRKPSLTEAFRTSYESPVRSPSCNPQGHGPRRVRSVDGIEPDRRGRN